MKRNWLLAFGLWDEESLCVTTPDIHTVNIKAEVVMNDGSRKPISKTLHVENPHLWSPDDPYLYHTTIEAEGDVLPVTYGIRTSHNPTTRAFLDACDSIGMLVIGEAFDGWRTAKKTYDYSTLIDSCYQEDIRAMVVRDRNHPSIICWSIGNEVIERKDIRVVHTAKMLKNEILKYDTTRPVTEALCAWDRDWEIYDPHFDVLDIGGYNYMIFKHASDHQRNPKRVMWQTESYPRDAFKNWKLVRDYPYIIGDMVWTGLDYLGESGIGRNYYDGETPGEHWRDGGVPEWHGAYCGDVDITGWRKPISHYREMLWKDSKDLYMAVREPDGYRGKINMTSWSVWPTWESWNWQGWEGKPIEVVDSEGRVCPDAAIPCEAIVKGQGQLMAFATADLQDREPKTSPRVTTWKGRALLVVRSSQKKGKAQVSIKSSLPTASIFIQSTTPSK